MSNAPTTGPKPKKSVALSGVPAGNTALCTVGRSGNDLHYRGYDIHDLAIKGCFEEVAYLLVHGALPTWVELNAYKAKLKRLRGLPAPVKAALAHNATKWGQPSIQVDPKANSTPKTVHAAASLTGKWYP